MIYRCCDDRRRSALENQSVYNGIDFLEVVDNPTDPDCARQRTLLVHFIHALAPGQLGRGNVQIQGGERISTISITNVTEDSAGSPAGDPRILRVQVERPGDFSPYTLRVVDAQNPGAPLASFDPVLSSIQFSFKLGCESEFDCRQQLECPPPAKSAVDISYLAKDYSSFRQLMLDRMAKILPQWQERNEADLGIVLIELLAYVGDYLSYQQDAVATEAYLGTARRRTSVRRHARLVDYPMHDGRNARTWVHFEVRRDVLKLTLQAGAGTKLLTKVNQRAVVMPIASPQYKQALQEKPVVFQLKNDVDLFPEHNRMLFYTWGGEQCCLPKGSTTAYLRGAFPNLKPSNVLIFQEVRGPNTGVPGDADGAHCQAVRLLTVTATSDPLGGRFDEPPTANKVDVTRIDWVAEDALTFPLCISSSNGSEFFDNVSVALGNIGLADHGLTIDEALDVVPSPHPALTLAVPPGADPCSLTENPCEASTPQSSPSRFRPELQQFPLTFTEAYNGTESAAATINGRQWDELKPAIQLTAAADPSPWEPQRDLLKSGAEKKEFVVETEDDGTAALRFGDGVLGARPAEGTSFKATYRIGNGVSGNIGANSLAHLASDAPAIVDLNGPVITAITNPLPAAGGVDPEPIERVRQRAPYAFRIQQRAVTEQDYADVAVRSDPTLDHATATFRWTGSWRTAFIAADRKGGLAVDEDFRTTLRNELEKYRMAGQDVDVETPAFVSLEIAIEVCVKPDYFASDVKQQLLRTLSNGTLADGRPAAFNPDNFTFGQTVYLSPIYERVMRTDGVESAVITIFQRQGIASNVGLDSGKLAMEKHEIARLDNDPNFPEHGKLTLNLHGGR